ncbi:MAG: hypothetical protein ACRCXZ_05205 [Patescibacteria group bacterium]
MNKNKIMLQNLVDLSKISMEMQGHVNTVFAGTENAKTSAMQSLKSLISKSESLVLKSETDLSNSFFLFIDKDDMMQFVSLLEEANNDLFKLANRRLLSETLAPMHSFDQELKLQNQLLVEIDNVLKTLSSKYKFSDLKNNLTNLKNIKSNIDTTVLNSIKNIVTEIRYQDNGSQLWEREILQIFENVFEKTSKFSNKLSEFIVKYE